MTKLLGLTAASLCVSASLILLGSLTSADESPPSAASTAVPRPYAKLQASLANLASTYDTLGMGPTLVAATERDLLAAGDSIRVVVRARPGKGAAALSALGSAGGRPELIHGDYIQAAVPLSALESLAASDAIRFVDEPLRLLPQAVISEGVAVSGASLWLGKGIRGAGTKVAIIDSGFKGYTSLLGSELPANVTARSFRSDGRMDDDEHGTACAEIVHDMAPAAQLYLIAIETELELGEAVDWLTTEGVDIVSFSMANPIGGPGDGTGPADDIVARAADAGILWVNSAGNAAENHWSGKWKDQDGDDFLEFGAGDESNVFTLAEGESANVYLKWNDPWEGSCNDYQLAVYDSSGSPVSLGFDNAQDCSTAPPTEKALVWATFTDDFSVKVKRVSADGQASFDLFVECGGSCSELEHATPEGSIEPPADAASALAVGAVDVATPNTIEDFSSRGPTEDGRIKPDLVAPDQVSTASRRPEPLGGTSASTPHVAGAAALVKQANPGFSPQQIKDFLEGRAVDLGDSGKDNVYGSGRLSLGAVPGPGPSPTPGPTRTTTPAATPTPTAGLLQNCPHAGKWAMSAWDGQSGTATEEALTTCSGDVQLAYWLDPETQDWLRYLDHFPELSNLEMLSANQAVLTLGSPSGSAQTSGASQTSHPLTVAQQAGQVENCPEARRWAMSTWSGPNGVDAAQALATCPGDVEAAYWLDPDTQGWLRYVRGLPLVSNLDSVNHMQAFFTLGSAAAPTVTPTPAPSPTPKPTATPSRTPTTTATPTPTATPMACPESGTYSGSSSGGGLFEFDVEDCAVSHVRIAEWVTCTDWLDAPAVVEFVYDSPLAIVGGAFSGQGSQSESGLYESWWHTSAQFSGQFTSATDARGQVDIQIEITGWPEHDTIYCDTEPPLTWRASQQ